ncbi:MAG: hypothetical protein QXR19_11235 [Candidatus Jordarchaeaceae archaeon]
MELHFYSWNLGDVCASYGFPVLGWFIAIKIGGSRGTLLMVFGSHAQAIFICSELLNDYNFVACGGLNQTVLRGVNHAGCKL